MTEPVTTDLTSDISPYYAPPDIACDECGAEAGEPCLPICTAPHGAGGPYEHHDPADDAEPIETNLGE